MLPQRPLHNRRLRHCNSAGSLRPFHPFIKHNTAVLNAHSFAHGVSAGEANMPALSQIKLGGLPFSSVFYPMKLIRSCYPPLPPLR